MNLIAKNLWINLTVVMPGAVTYGTLRIVVSIIGYKGIDFKPIDNSTVLSLSVLLAIALLQQVIGISVEATIAGIVHLNKSRWENAHALFVERFSSLATERFNEDVMRTIGQFFLSLNLAIGQILILIFLINVHTLKLTELYNWIYPAFALVISVAIIVACFRCWNAIEAIRSSGVLIEEEQPLSSLEETAEA